MSDRTPESRAWLFALTAVAVLSCAYADSPRRPASESAYIDVSYENYISVDSEHGVTNGWFSPKIIYDVYVRTPDGREFLLLATPDTGFYRRRDGGLDKIPVRDLNAGAKVRARIGEIDYSGHRPTAYVSRLVASE